MKCKLLSGLILLLLMTSTESVRADESLQRFSGDGLTIVIRTLDDDTGKVTGDLLRDGKSFPFTGQIQEENTGEAVTGSFVAAGETFRFTSRVEPDTGIIHFTTGNKTYKLKPETPEPKPDAPRNNENPLNSDAPAKRNPLESDAPPAKPNPLNEGAAEPPASVASTPTAGKDDSLRLKLVKFNDITMGGLPAYTMLIPHDWKSSGHIEWGPAENPFPQNRTRADGPDGSAVAFFPHIHMSYAEFKPVQGLPPLPNVGVPAPQRPGDFIVHQLRTHGKDLTNVRLVEDKRDHAAEKAMADQAGQGLSPEIKVTVHVVTVAYEKNGKPMREQMLVSYARYPDYEDMNSRSQAWSLGFMTVIAAPENRFEATKEMLYKIAGTYRPIPNWWVQQFEARQRIQNQRHIDVMAEIKRRGEFYNSMSDMQYDNFKKNMSAMDKGQKDRIDSIYERQDYKDVDGKPVNFTFHYKHVYSDGSGNYVLTNNPLRKPADGNFKEIEPVR